MNDLWAWISESIEQFRQAQDRPRFEMAMQFHRGLRSLENDPEQALTLLAEARLLSVRYGERWWTLLCDHWTCQALIHRTRDIDEAAHLATQSLAITETETAFSAFPQRVCLHDDKISALQMIDPEGFGQEIDAGCDFIEQHGANLEGCRHCMWGTRIEALIVRGEVDPAEGFAIAGLKSCTTKASSHYTPQYYVALCRIAKIRKDWAKLAHWSQAGGVFYGHMGSSLSNIELLMWHAVALLLGGNPVDGGVAYRKARSAKRSSNFGMTAGYYNALSLYHETGGRLEWALIARKLELQNTSGAPYLECVCRIERIRLLKALGRSFDDELEALNIAAQKLRNPASILAQMEQVTA